MEFKKEKMEVISVNFEEWVLERIKEKAKANGTSVSKFVNYICRRVLMNDKLFCRFMMKQALQEQHYWEHRVKIAEDVEEGISERII